METELDSSCMKPGFAEPERGENSSGKACALVDERKNINKPSPSPKESEVVDKVLERHVSVEAEARQTSPGQDMALVDERKNVDTSSASPKGNESMDKVANREESIEAEKRETSPEKDSPRPEKDFPLVDERNEVPPPKESNNMEPKQSAEAEPGVASLGNSLEPASMDERKTSDTPSPSKQSNPFVIRRTMLKHDVLKHKKRAPDTPSPPRENCLRQVCAQIGANLTETLISSEKRKRKRRKRGKAAVEPQPKQAVIRKYLSGKADTPEERLAVVEPKESYLSPFNYQSAQAEVLSQQLEVLGLMQGSGYGQTAPLKNLPLADGFLSKAGIRNTHDTIGEPSSRGLPKAAQEEKEAERQAECLNMYLDSANDGEIASNIHILGTGNIGRFIAHSLVEMPNPPKITLLLHRPLRIQQWYDEGQTVTLYAHGQAVPRTGFHVESSFNIQFDPFQSYPSFGPNLETSIVPPNTIIDHLIVTTKANTSLPAIAAVKSRLRPSSTICFIHNGSGVLEQINKHIFPDPVTRPSYIVGTTSHGIHSVDGRQFSCVYSGQGEIHLCHLDRHWSPLRHSTALRRSSLGYPPSVRYLSRTLTRCVELRANGYSYQDFLLLKLEKLAVNAVINPLSVIYDCRNQALLNNISVRKTMHTILEEISAVYLALPELNSDQMAATRSREVLERRLSPVRLKSIVESIAEKTGTNFSSMLQDVKKGNTTEIAFINGYIARRGEEVGVPTPVNNFLVNAVKGRLINAKKELENYIPFMPGLANTDIVDSDDKMDDYEICA